jgi:peptidoglycan-N-acetylmuramic acid deacetylase
MTKENYAITEENILEQEILNDWENICMMLGKAGFLPKRRLMRTAVNISMIATLLTSCAGIVFAKDEPDNSGTGTDKKMTARVSAATALPTLIPRTAVPTSMSAYTMTPAPTATLELMDVADPSPTYSTKEMIDTLSKEEVDFLARHEIFAGRTDKKVVMMTYDDGGSEEKVKSVIDVYEKYGVKATFFVTGEWVKAHPDLVRRMVDSGFDVGAHGWNHEALTAMSGAAASKQLGDFVAAMEVAAPGYRVKYMRFPYGARADYLRLIAAQYGMQSVMWSNESGGNTERTFEYATRNLKPGEIVLSHSIRYYDVLYAERIIQYFQSQGYDLVTIDEGIKPSDVFGGR